MFWRIKVYLEEQQWKIVLFAIIILAITLGFGLGYLTAKDVNRAPIIIEKAK